MCQVVVELLTGVRRIYLAEAGEASEKRERRKSDGGGHHFFHFSISHLARIVFFFFFRFSRRPEFKHVLSFKRFQGVEVHYNGATESKPEQFKKRNGLGRRRFVFIIVVFFPSTTSVAVGCRRRNLCDLSPFSADSASARTSSTPASVQPEAPRLRDPGVLQAKGVRGPLALRSRVRGPQALLRDSGRVEPPLLERLAEEERNELVSPPVYDR